MQKKYASYQNVYRPIYEHASIWLWAIFIFNTIGYVKYYALPFIYAMIVSLLALLYIIYQFRQGIQLSQFQPQGEGHSLTFMNVDALSELMTKHDDLLWLGEGFEWTAEHTQRLIDFQRMHSKISKSSQKSIEKESSTFGAHWLHGLDAKQTYLFQPLLHTEGHTLIVGTTGAGKTRCFDTLITQAILRNEAVIIIDPKGDKALCNNAKRACEHICAAERFIYFHPGFPEHSVKINPLRNFNRGTEIASRIAALIPSETGADPFKAFGQMALNNIVQGLLIIGQRPSLKTLRYYLESGPEELVVKAVYAYAKKNIIQFNEVFTEIKVKANNQKMKMAHYLYEYYFSEVQPHYPNSDLEGLLSMFKHDRTHYSKMVASLMPVLNMLTSSELGPLLSPKSTLEHIDDKITDFAKIIQTNSVAYIGLDSLTDAMVGSAIGSLLLSDLTAVAGDRYNYGIENLPVNIFIDEAAEVINDPFIQLLNKGRGAKMRCVVATQTFADFAARTGSEAKALQVLGNINNFLIFRIMDAKTQQYVADNFPMVRINTIINDIGTNNHAEELLLASGSAGKRLQEEEVTLFPKDLLGQLPNLEYIAMVSGGKILKGRLPILTTH
ncbi:conjugative transfer system coupling protein TraD [Thorsellia kenyensis]